MPVLVAHEDGVAEEPIIGFNVIEVLLERGIDPTRVTDAISTAFSFDCKKAEVFLNVMMSGEDGLGEVTVKTGRGLMTIPAGQTRAVRCSVRAGPLPEHQDVLFEPNPHPQLPDGLEVHAHVVHLQQGTWSHITFPITNNTAHEILLPPKTVLGQTQRVKTIYPADTRPVEINQTETTMLTTKQASTPARESQMTELEHRTSKGLQSPLIIFPQHSSRG